MAYTPVNQLTPEAQAELADMALALAHNPKTRKGFAKLAKEAGAPYRFNDVEAEEAVVAAAGKVVDDKFAETERQRAARETERRLNEQRQSLITSGRYDEATVKDKIEPFMAEKGIVDYNDGAVLYGHANPAPDPRREITGRGAWEMPKGNWITDRIATSRKEAYAEIDAIRARR